MSVPKLERVVEEWIDDMVAASKKAMVTPLPPAPCSVRYPTVLDIGDHIPCNMEFLGLVDATQPATAFQPGNRGIPVAPSIPESAPTAATPAMASPAKDNAEMEKVSTPAVVAPKSH